MMKRNLSILLALLLCMGLLPMQVQAAGIPFTDVPTGAWYYADVKNAYESGLINGKNPTTFAPNDNMVYAEAIKLAACMHQKYTTGKVTLQNGSPWYQTYVDYALQNKIITREYDWNAQATRAGYMEIFAGALPEEAMKQINTVQDGSIPDVPMTHVQAKAIYKLYRVGILQGNDEAHSCNPGGAIIRGEVAAILTRMMDSSKRVTFTLGETPKKLTITQEVEEEIIVAPGDKVIATVGVGGGSGKYTYQWQYRTASGDWKNVPGGTEATLTHTPSDAQLTKDLEYRCVIKDSTGAKVTTKSLTTRAPEPSRPLEIIGHPEDVTADGQERVTFTVTAVGGTAPYTYVWQYADDTMMFNGTVLPMEVKDNFSGNDTDTITGILDKNDMTKGLHVRACVTDATGKFLYSDFANVNIRSSLTIAGHPADVRAKEGDTVNFTVAASGGTAPYTYVWQYATQEMYDHGTVLPMDYKDNFGGKTTDTITGTITKKDLLDGLYVRACVTDANGKFVYSNFAKLIDNTPPMMTFYTQPKSIEIAPGGEAKFEVEIEGGQYPYSFQWQAYGGVWADVRHVANVSIDVDEGYGISLLKTKDASLAEHPMRVIVTDKNGNQLITEEFQFTIKKEPLIITSQPQSVSCAVGETVTFNVGVGGGTPGYTYKWRFAIRGGSYNDVMNGANTTGQGTSQLTVKTTEGHITSNTTFICVVKDQAGNTVETNVVKLNVDAPKPLSAKITFGEVDYDRRPYTCNVTGGVGPYTYRWVKKDNTFLGSTQTCWVYKNSWVTEVICTVTDSSGQSVTIGHAVWF